MKNIFNKVFMLMLISATTVFASEQSQEIPALDSPQSNREDVQLEPPRMEDPNKLHEETQKTDMEMRRPDENREELTENQNRHENFPHQENN